MKSSFDFQMAKNTTFTWNFFDSEKFFSYKENP